MEIVKGKVDWINIVSPDSKDIEWLKQEFNFHHVILEELGSASARTHVESYGDYLYIVYQFPVYDSEERVSKRCELDILITKDAVITVQYESIEPLEAFRKDLETSRDKRSKVLVSSLQLVYHIFAELSSYNQRQLRHIHDKVEKVSWQMFKDREHELLKDISYLKRDISEYRFIISPQEQLLRSLLEHGTTFWGPQAKVYLNDILGDFLKVMTRIEDYRQAVTDFQDTNTQIMNLKTTRVMKMFTILSFMTFPFVLLVAILSMNVDGNPIVHTPGGFWLILSLVVAGVSGMSAYFKKKDWL